MNNRINVFKWCGEFEVVERVCMFRPEESLFLPFETAQGFYSTNFCPRGKTFKALRYCETPKNYGERYITKGMIRKGVCLFHDNLRPHTANSAKQLLDLFAWDTINHSAAGLT